MAYHDPNTRLYKTSEGAVVGGVCAGLSEYLKIDVSILRIIAIGLAFTAVGILPYIVLWIALPRKSDIT